MTGSVISRWWQPIERFVTPVWCGKRKVNGRELTFRLAGINNQNFLMRDEETGSYWQQISGAAIAGPYRGQQLELVYSDELTCALWRNENPNGTVLRPVDKFASKYEDKNWETAMQKARTVIDTSKTPLRPRELMIGVEHNGAARAYIFDRVLQQKLIQDSIGGTAVIVVTGPDAKSVRVFEARFNGDESTPEFYCHSEAQSGSAFDSRRAMFIDSVTGSEWSFQGCAVSGPAQGQCLKALPAIKDYWFDWHLYHPQTTVHSVGAGR